jgi:short-subunit dehydrogenase
MATALVTGASSGLGEQFARQLSARGYDLALVARREQRLQAIADELPGDAVVVSHDLAADPGGLVDRVDELELEVDLLVNNAGFGTYGRIWEIEEGRDAELVRLNCEAVVVLTRAFLPPMLERRRGGVIVVASTAGMQPLPYEATYAASKAFALSYTEALSEELRGTGVRALAVNPGPVPTEWQQVAGHDDVGVVPGEIPAEQCVAEALEAWDAGRRTVIPGRLMRWVMRGSRLGPRALQLRVAERLYRPDR